MNRGKQCERPLRNKNMSRLKSLLECGSSIQQNRKQQKEMEQKSNINCVQLQFKLY